MATNGEVPQNRSCHMEIPRAMNARDIIQALLFATLFVALPASAQSPLSLSEAIARAKVHNPDAGAAAQPSGKRRSA